MVLPWVAISTVQKTSNGCIKDKLCCNVVNMVEIVHHMYNLQPYKLNSLHMAIFFAHAAINGEVSPGVSFLGPPQCFLCFRRSYYSSEYAALEKRVSELLYHGRRKEKKKKKEEKLFNGDE